MIRIFLAVFALTGCVSQHPDFSSESVIEVNQSKLSAKEFAEELVFKLRSFDPVIARKQQVIEQAKNQITNEFMISSIVSGWAQKNDMKVTDQDLEASFAEFSRNFPDRNALLESLSKEGISVTEWKRRQKTNLLQKKVMKRLTKDVATPTEKEMKLYYEANISQYSQAEAIKLRQIVLTTEAAAKQIKEQINKKKIDFKDAARKFSIAPEAKQDGLVGWVEKGTIEVFDKAFGNKRMLVSGVHQSPYGWHLFRHEGVRKSSKKSFSEVKSSIKRVLQMKREQAKYTDWLDTQIRLSSVKINQELLNAILVETRDSK